MRELDGAIAEALGYIPCEKWNVMQSTMFMGDIYNKNCDHEKCYPTKQPVAYSTDGNAMLELDREMRERGYVLSLRHHNLTQYVVIYTGEPAGWGISTLVPTALALAAYKALTGKDWEGE